MLFYNLHDKLRYYDCLLYYLNVKNVCGRLWPLNGKQKTKQKYNNTLHITEL